MHEGLAQIPVISQQVWLAGHIESDEQPIPVEPSRPASPAKPQAVRTEMRTRAAAASHSF